MKKPAQNPRLEAKIKPSRAELEAVELDSDAWPKFEALMKSAAKMGHKPHLEPKKSKSSSGPQRKS
jgi:hypothetical protein